MELEVECEYLLKNDARGWMYQEPGDWAAARTGSLWVGQAWVLIHTMVPVIIIRGEMGRNGDV